MEAPSPKLEERYENFNKTTTENENYSLSLKIKKKNSIYISITFEKDNKIYEDSKLYDEIKKSKLVLMIITLKKFLMKFLY